MTPAARLNALIDLIDSIESTPRPADSVMSAFFRARRYMGSKDRAAVSEQAYRILRSRHRLSWWLERIHFPPTSRLYAIADLIFNGCKDVEDIKALFSGGQYGPPLLGSDELKAVKALHTHTLIHPDMPESVRLECPAWAEPLLKKSLSGRFHAEMTAMLSPATLDVRVNILKASREEAQKMLQAEGISAHFTPYSPWGLRLDGRPALTATDAFQKGSVDIQDEGSQLIAVVVDAKPGQQVVDFCAGAGGKTLALAATMNNKGRIIAADVLGNRLKRAAERFRRAGVHNIETRALSSEKDPWIKRHKQSFDRVLVDAPCSGTGTWRRNPDARWRSLGPGLTDLVPLQASILQSASRLVKPGGRLIYGTCSLLHEENEDQITSFLAHNPDFSLVPVASFFDTVTAKTVSSPEGYLKMSPERHKTDGFFAAILERHPLITEGKPA